MMATQHYTQKPATYICVDSDMEEVNGGHENHNGGLLYVVEAVCGSLKCPPYENGYEIACSVCTRQIQVASEVYKYYHILELLLIVKTLINFYMQI